MIPEENPVKKRPQRPRRIRGRLSAAAQREALTQRRSIELLSKGYGIQVAGKLKRPGRFLSISGRNFDEWASDYPDYARLLTGAAPSDPMIFSSDHCDDAASDDDGIDHEDAAARFLDRRHS
jgi:hypothetical protein